MPPSVTATAVLQCSFGMAPSTLTVLPLARVMIGGKPAATMTDNVPMLNIAPFGMCMSLANPTVAAATAAALGVLTPMPCIPATTAPWVPPSPTVMIGGKPAITSNAKCLCNWGGVISIIVPQGFTTMMP